jgi:hypothetical protein
MAAQLSAVIPSRRALPVRGAGNLPVVLHLGVPSMAPFPPPSSSSSSKQADLLSYAISPARAVQRHSSHGAGHSPMACCPQPGVLLLHGRSLFFFLAQQQGAQLSSLPSLLAPSFIFPMCSSKKPLLSQQPWRPTSLRSGADPKQRPRIPSAPRASLDLRSASLTLAVCSMKCAASHASSISCSSPGVSALCGLAVL